MNGKKCKVIRRAIYADHGEGPKDFRMRSYFYHRDNPRTFVADHLRRAYQAAKRFSRGFVLMGAPDA